MDHPQTALYATSGVSGGFTLDAMFRWLASPDARTFLPFVLSLACTSIGGAMALWTKSVQARLERERLVREAAYEAAREAREAAREARQEARAERLGAALDALKLRAAIDPHAGQVEVKDLDALIAGLTPAAEA